MKWKCSGINSCYFILTDDWSNHHRHKCGLSSSGQTEPQDYKNSASCAVISRVWQLHVVRIDPRFKSIWNPIRVQTHTHIYSTHTYMHNPTRPHTYTQSHNQNIKFCVQMLCKLCCALLALVSGSCWVVPHQRKKKINHKRNGGSLPWPVGDNYLQTLADNSSDNEYALVLFSSVMILAEDLHSLLSSLNHHHGHECLPECLENCWWVPQNPD